MKKYLACLFVACIACIAVHAKEYYSIVVYHFTQTLQQTIIDNYLKNAYLPALKRLSVKNIGVFKPISNDTAVDKKIYIIIPFHELSEIAGLEQKLLKDKQYLSDGKDYLNVDYKTPVYTRIESIFVESFRLAPEMILPKLKSAKTDRIYELRSYESPSEKYFVSKVKMFNEGGEIDIFKRINSNAVFYGTVIAGDRMPNLMYLTCYENMQDRDEHWKAFGDDADWKKISAMDEYKNNVAKADIILCKAAEYSDY